MVRLTTITLSLLAFVIVSTSPARAQTPPPPWMPGPSPQDLIRRGHDKKIAGGVLMGVGSLLLATSITLNVLEVIGPVDHHCDAFSPVCGDGARRGELWLGSMAAFAIGLPTLGAGIATYAVGGYQMRKGKRLQLVGFAAAPTPDGAVASAAFRF
jgi:hypothetical protein